MMEEIWGSLLIEAIRINDLPRETERKEQHCGARQEVKHIKQKWLKSQKQERAEL